MEIVLLGDENLRVNLFLFQYIDRRVKEDLRGKRYRVLAIAAGLRD